MDYEIQEILRKFRPHQQVYEDSSETLFKSI
jgi:hypothetical protein